MTADERAVGVRQATYLTFIGVFLGGFGLVTRRGNRRSRATEVRPMDLALLGLATYRIGRLTAYDRVTQLLREPFTEREPAAGAGEIVVAQGTGARKALGELLSCPTCIGTWAAAALVYGLQLMPVPTRLFLAIMSATGVAELLDAATEALSWTGKAARKRAGSETP